MVRDVRRALPLLLVVLVVGCGQATQQPASSARGGAEGEQPTQPHIGRTLVMAGRSEAPSVASRPLRSFGLTSSTETRLFNAGLTLRDGQGAFRPYLAEALPQLNSDSWKVSPDGRMETTYHLKPNLVWQDGVPLTANDFVFAYEVYSLPDLGQAASAPLGTIEEVLAPDDRTVVVRWRSLYADAGNLDSGNGSVPSATGFPPLPRHLIETPLHEDSLDAFIGLPFWSTEYVGLGPFTMDRWEPGAYFEGVAFDQHVLGRPKIDRVRMLFIPDFNTSLANMLAGEAHITVDDSIRFEQAMVLRRQWESTGAGQVLIYPSLWRHAYFQQRREYARPITFTDARIRKALMYSVDKQALSEALFEGQGILTDTPIPPTSPAFADVDRVATKYPYDLRQTVKLMAEAGYAKGPDGVWAHPTVGRFAFELDTFQSPQNENEMHIMADTWRQAGYDVSENVFAASLSSNYQLRDTQPGINAASFPSGEVALIDHASKTLPTAGNRWSGVNRGGWTNGDFDRLAEQLDQTLARDERAAILTQMAKVFSEDAAVISLYFNPTTTAFVANLKGPKPSVPESTTSWDVYDWEWTS